MPGRRLGLVAGEPESRAPASERRTRSRLAVMAGVFPDEVSQRAHRRPNGAGLHTRFLTVAVQNSSAPRTPRPAGVLGPLEPVLKHVATGEVRGIRQERRIRDAEIPSYSIGSLWLTRGIWRV